MTNKKTNKKKDRVCITITIDGKRKYFYGESKLSVEKKKEEYLYKLEHPVRLLKEVGEAWENEHREEIKHKTWLGYRGHYNSIMEEFGDRDISEITRLNIEMTIRALANRKYSYKTVKAKFNVWNMIFKHALYNGYVEHNPCDQVKIPKGLPKGKRELPSNIEIEKVKNSLFCHFGLFTFFLLFTGLRRGEALAIEWKDIDFDNSIIRINKAVSFENNRPKIQGTKTINGIRVIPLLVPLKVALEQQDVKEGYLFGNTAPMSEQAFRRAWERYCKQSTVTITPHQLRHAFATILYDAEISSKSAQKILGHADYKTTVEIYTHISEKRNAFDMEKLNSYVASF